jgi:hypothetical protein
MPGTEHVVCAEDPPALAAPLAARPDLTDEESVPPRRRLFPGEACQVSQMRQWLKSLLPDCPARDDVVYVACELATNAVQHTLSGQGGWFRVEVIVRARQLIRVAVADCGGPSTPQIVDELHWEHGRGLRVVRALSERDGYSGDEDGRQVWAEIPWQGVSQASV